MTPLCEGLCAGVPGEGERAPGEGDAPARRLSTATGDAGPPEGLAAACPAIPRGEGGEEEEEAVDAGENARAGPRRV